MLSGCLTLAGRTRPGRARPCWLLERARLAENVDRAREVVERRGKVCGRGHLVRGPVDVTADRAVELRRTDRQPRVPQSRSALQVHRTEVGPLAVPLPVRDRRADLVLARA